ncbi:MAG: glycerophosphodiester phosphodiesterase [Pseudopedobacter saltans]|uniref:Glycerophosphodiester phosphodiesterase n=1 Tax=Pseudopedobacter saltans TaxID=151895 RepID=A0A2W5F2J0_9SPHI|nr:MAG: glycerophosphodiester phosphodiesterase [Pseudopedobacter saltans]
MKVAILGITALVLVTSACKSVKKLETEGFNKNVVVAHRGAWKAKNLPENSIASLQEAIRIGCTGSEFDVHLTADDSLVVCHNDDYAGMVIEKSTFAQLATKPLSNGERIPTLREYLLAGNGQHKTRLVLEIKKSIIDSNRTLVLTQKCVEEVSKLNAKENVVYISFDYAACLKVRELDKNANIQYLNSDFAPSKIKADNINGIDYHLSAFKKHPEWIAEAKKLKVDLNVWTVNSKEDLQYFLDQKFDFITTNEPELLFSLIQK